MQKKCLNNGQNKTDYTDKTVIIRFLNRTNYDVHLIPKSLV